jgi:hypothetical protein
MALITLICPHCGGDFELDPDRNLQPYWVCPYCGNRSLMQKSENTVRLRGIISGKTSQTSFGTPSQNPSPTSGAASNGANGISGTAGVAGAPAPATAAGVLPSAAPTRPANGFAAGASATGATSRFGNAGIAGQKPGQSAELAAFLAGAPMAAAEPKRTLADIIAEAIAEPATPTPATDNAATAGNEPTVIGLAGTFENAADLAEGPTGLPVSSMPPAPGPPVLAEGAGIADAAGATEAGVAGGYAVGAAEAREKAVVLPAPDMEQRQSQQSAAQPEGAVRPIDVEQLLRSGAGSPELEVYCQLAEAAAKRHDMPLFNSYSRRAIDLEPTDPRMYAWRAILIEEAGGFARSTWTTPLWQLQAPSRKMALVAQHFYNLSTSLRFCQEIRRPELINRIASLIVKQTVDHFHEQAVLRCRQNLLFKTFKGHYRRVDLHAADSFIDACRHITAEAFPINQTELLEALRGEIRLLPKSVNRRLNRF